MDDELTLRQIRLERLRRMQDEQYRYYIPNGKAEKFIQVVGNNLHFINLFIAANGVGKTATLVNILANICFDPVNQYFRYPLFENFPYPRKGRVISDPTTIAKTLDPEIIKWFPLGKFESFKAGKTYNSKFVIPSTGFDFDLMTYEQDIKEFESSTLGFAILDEPCPEAIFKATISRMRRGGLLILGFTPLTGSAFFYDNYATAPEAKKYV